MKTDAYIWVHVPSNNIPHYEPLHFYTGYTACGLACIIESCGFELLEVGQYGHLQYLLKILKHNRWFDYRKVKNPGLNNPNSPLISWCLAQKKV